MKPAQRRRIGPRRAPATARCAAVSAHGARALLLLAALLAGCGRAPEEAPPAPPAAAKPPVPRTQDPVYQQALTDVRAKQTAVARARHAVATEMARLVEQARAALPPDATDEQVKAELDGHPKTYPAWRGLQERLARQNARLEDSLAEARRVVGARLRQEAAERAAAGQTTQASRDLH